MKKFNIRDRKTNDIIISNIGLFISFNDNPKLKIAMISLSFSNFRKARTNPKAKINGKVTFIKLGIIRRDNCSISKVLICRLFITAYSLDNCNNQAIDINIKKTSVQEFTN